MWVTQEPTALKTPCPGTDQSEETMTLKGHTWRTDNVPLKSSPETSPKILTFKKGIKA